MPRPEDIAWKFVVRLEGKRWRCPYCHKESSGSVTRVKSHFLKQSKGGIASCTKVPEHIRTLMESLQNHELHNKDDIAWKFVNRVEGSKWRCYYCSGEFVGDLTGVKGHLLGVPNEGISSCTGVPEHVRTLMRSLLDAVAEEESGGANSPLSIGALFSPGLEDVMEQLNFNQQDVIGLNSDQQSQAKCRFNSTMPSVEQNSLGNSQHSRIAPQHTSDSRIIEATIVDLQVSEAATNTTGPSSSQGVSGLMRSLLDEVAEEESREANGQSSTEPQAHDMPTQAEVVAEEESREANGQFSMESQTRDMPTQAVAEEESREVNHQFSVEPELRDTLPQAVPSSSVASFEYMENFLCEEAFVDQDSAWAMLLSAQDSHVQPALVPHQDQSVLHQSINHETRDTQWNATMPLDNLDTTQQPDLHDFPPENFVEYRDVIVNSSEEIQMNEQHNLTVGSSLQNDLSPDVDSTNRLQDCSQPCVGEGVSGLSNTSPTNAVQHPDQLHPRCDWEGRNDTHFVPSPTPVDVNCFLALPHSSDSLDNLHVLEAATNAIGSSSSQDLNRGYQITTVQNINANDEEIRNLKQKVEELNDKEAVIKKKMEIESAASSVQKKPRLVQWLEETEMARNSFHIIGQANGETLPPKEQVETLTREVEKLIGQTTLLIEERDAKGVKLLERKLTGEAIHRNIELIWGHLKENHACKLGIYGMGGVGKTTIMVHIHNRLLKDATFDGVVFITVSKDCSIYKLQSDIWKALEFGVMEDGHEKKRAAMLLEQLERKKNCVLILDDVWERLDLEEVGIPVRADGCKLVLTTRSFDVCCQMHCQEKIKIEPLSQIEAESLFLEELGSEVPLNSETEAIVKSIVEECAGLPIGVITMARSMRGVTDVFEWRDSLVKLKESSKGQTDMEKKVLMNLKFSYDRLGNPDVQQCFLSCALYPEDELIKKFELVEFFIDQGLIGGLNTRRDQYDRGLTILNKLRNVCLLEDHGSKMKMHDLIRDMALHIMSATSIVKAGKRLESIPSEEYWTDALEKVSLMGNEISEISLNMSPNCPKLSTLLLNGSWLENGVLPGSFFKQLCGLKVLNLSDSDLIELPNSISDLVNLRALLLIDCQGLCHIPYLGKLTSLRKLDIAGCFNLEEVPEGLEMLVNLRYLDLCFSLAGELPKRVLDGLLNLQHLKVYFLDGQDMTKLRALETLECSFEDANDFNKCVRVIEQSNPRCYYYLCYYLDRDEKIYEGYRDIPQFENLEREVNIWEWDHAIVSVGGECTGIFILIPQDVRTMNICCNDITNLSSIGPLEYLEELYINYSKNLGVLCGGEDKEVIDIFAPALAPLLFPSLTVLKIRDCPKLKYLFGHGSKFDLPHLREIEIGGCEETVGIIAAVTSPPPHPLPFFPSLEQISITRCNKMKRAVESEWMPHFPNLRRISAVCCEKMEEIIGGPPPYSPDEQISLESLEVSYCDNMRKLLTYEWLLHLRNLQSIEVDNCKGMVELISGAGQGQEGSITTSVNNTPSSFQPSSISLPKLECLKLHDLHQLKSIYEAPIGCDFMKRLDVYRCPELKRIPLQLRLCEIEKLPYILVEEEEKWKTLVWDHPDAQAILRPYLRKEHLQKGPYWSLNAIVLNTK